MQMEHCNCSGGSLTATACRAIAGQAAKAFVKCCTTVLPIADISELLLRAEQLLMLTLHMITQAACESMPMVDLFAPLFCFVGVACGTCLFVKVLNSAL